MVDLTFLKQFTKGDPVKMRRYITLYLEVAPKTFEEMQQNFQHSDWEQLRINAHSLKPQADFMGINSLKEALVKIEECALKGELQDLEDLVPTARSISAESAQVLKELLAEL